MESPNVGRKRQETTRSRAGCLTCKKRHIRCDEEQPKCTNCVTSKRKCEYAAAGLPSSDRRVQGRKPLLPGQQTPWLVSNNCKIPISELNRDAAVDPFDVLPITMPYKSKELFHYFHQFGSGEMELESSAADCLSLAITDRHALRGTLLIAGLHYSWNVGNLETFQAAFLFHKLEIIRNLNGWLECADRETVMLCVRQICTLCLSEVCFGNIAAAQAHLDGLMKFLDVAEKRNLASVDADDTDTELANRYIILTSNFLHILKSRLNDFVLFRDENGASPFWDKFSPYALDLMHKWHKIEHRGLENRLKAMRMLPHFFCPITTTRKSTKINGRPAMDSITQMTNAVDRRNGNSGSKYDNRVWNDGAPNQLFVDYVHGHMSSFSEEDMTSPYSLSRGNGGSECLPSSWGGVAAAGGLYMQSVLNVANVEEPIDPRLIRRLVMIIKRDMDHNVNDMRGQHGKVLQDFWFWKSFVAALALAINKRDLERRKAPWPAISEEGAWSLQSILRLMESRIRRWSEVTDVKEWRDAKAVLGRCVWPSVWSVGEERFAEALWYRAVGSRAGN